MLWRGVISNIYEKWTEETDNLLRLLNLHLLQLEFMKAFPHRVWYRICDIAPAVALLASDAVDFITDQVYIDGGTMGMCHSKIVEVEEVGDG